MLDLNILKRMWFTDYRASKYEYESDCVTSYVQNIINMNTKVFG